MLSTFSRNYSKSQKSRNLISQPQFLSWTAPVEQAVHYTCPGSLPQLLVQIWWLLKKSHRQNPAAFSDDQILTKNFKSQKTSQILSWDMSKHLGSSGAIWSKLDEFPKVFHFNAQNLWNYSKSKCSTLMLSTFSRNLAKSQKSKIQIALTATVFELDSSSFDMS